MLLGRSRVGTASLGSITQCLHREEEMDTLAFQHSRVDLGLPDASSAAF